MSHPHTTDERERRFVSYVTRLNKREIGTLRLANLNRLAEYRKELLQMINDLVETRAEDLAAAMLAEHAPEIPVKIVPAFGRGRRMRRAEWISRGARTARGNIT